MKMSLGALVFRGALGLMGVMVGCGGGSSGGAADKDQFLSQVCAEYADCCEAAGLPSNGAQCRAFYAAFTASDGYDPAAGAACLDEIRALGSKKCDSMGMDPASCSGVFISNGTKQPGEPCDSDSDCAPAKSGTTRCAFDFVDGATVQQCQVQLAGKAGSAPCVGTRDGNSIYSASTGDGIPSSGYLCDVADGLSCDDTSGACIALGAVGEACSGSFPDCVSSAYCDFLDDTCKARVALGDACTSDDQCVAGAHCDGTCVELLQQGEACSTSDECASSNCTNQKCASGNDLGLTLLCGSN